MYISKEHKAIFIHNPKTGGGSITQTLVKNGFVRLIEEPDKWEAHNKWSGQHPEYFKFCFVRNPYSAIVSKYRVIRNKLNKKISDANKEQILELKKWKYYRLKEGGFKEFIRYFYKEMNDQHLFTIGMDFFGRFENMDKDFKMVCEKINIKNYFLNNKFHYFGEYDYMSYYNNSTIDLVVDLFSEDLKKLGYSFKGMANV